jgi:hypothetical protein
MMKIEKVKLASWIKRIYVISNDKSYIRDLRGDVRKGDIDIYDHMDKKELRVSYFAHVSQLRA